MHPASHKSTCSYCGVGCGVVVGVNGRGRITVEGDAGHPGSQGMLCTKGMNLHHTVMNREDRLTEPLMRASRGHQLLPVDWETALDRAAAVFRSLIRRHGPRSVALYCSGQMLTEEYYIANKLMKGFIGSNNIDTNSRLCMSSAVAAYKQALGDDLVPIAYDDIERCECFLIAGANPAWCHPILYRRLERHKEANPEVRVIVADPRRTQTCSLADLHLQLRPGTDVTLLNAIARELIESGRIDREFIREHTEGFDRARQAAFALSAGEAAERCGVPAADIRLAARWIGDAPTYIGMWAMGLNQSAEGVGKNLALMNLSLLTGAIGRPGCGPFSLTGQPNAMGGREVGGMANLLAAHRDLADPAQREEVARYWGGGPIDPRPGLTAVEMFEALDRGELKAIWIINTNPAVSMPHQRLAERALARARFVIVQEISREAATLPFADLVLPAAGWLEKAGTMTSSERRVSYLPKLVDPPGQARADTRILCDFAARMGWGERFHYADEAEIFAEHARLTAGTTVDISGLSHARLRGEGSIQWPCPAADPPHPGTQRLFGDRQFATPSGRARFHGIASSPPAEAPSPDYPLILTTGRVRDQWHTMTRTGKVGRLRQHVRRPFLEMHPTDAEARGLRDGETVQVSSPDGEAQLPLSVTETIRRGVVFAPMHWNRSSDGLEGRANALTSSRVDPVSREPDFKYSTVQVRRIRRPARRVAVVGAGAAALEFVRTYRRTNREDEIHVFGREPLMFYNRVLLIEYLSGRRRWEDLLTCDEPTLAELDVRLHQGCSVEAIDRKGRTLRDADGRDWPWDALVLATGSRPLILPDAPVHLDGVFSIRSRADAERIQQQLDRSAKVVVIGGGLLGLEMVGEMLQLGIDVTVIQNTPTLMGRQLDETAADILREILEDRGARVILHDTVQRYFGRDRIEGLRTTAGRLVNCDLLILATGIRPNVELAREAGLDVRRGVIVDDRMRSSDPLIYAIGEIAEHRGLLYGTTPAAQDQARVAAAHLTGDLWAEYRGSVLFNILKIPGVEVCSIGQAAAPANDPEWNEVVLLDRERQYYKKCVLRRDTLVGAILIGDQSEFAEFRRMIADEVELGERRDAILRPGVGAATPIEGPLVCSCNGVGRGNLERLIVEEGCIELDSLCARSRAGTGCGSCRPEIKALLAEFARPQVVAPGDDDESGELAGESLSRIEAI